MGRRGRPPKNKEEVQKEPQEIENIEPKKEEIEVLETDEEVKEPIPEPEENEKEIEVPDNEVQEETSDFDLTKQNEYLIAGFKASKYYTTDKNYVEENFKKYVKTGE